MYGYTACPHSESGEHHRDCLPAGECQSGSRVWCALCLDHSCALAPQVASLAGLLPITRIFSTYTTPSARENMAEIIAPQGRIGLIDDPEPLDLRLIKFKSVSVHWEAMFTRPCMLLRTCLNSMIFLTNSHACWIPVSSNLRCWQSMAG